MIPVFKDEEAKKNYINSMLGFLLSTKKVVAEAEEKVKESIASDNTDQLIDALEFFGSCIFSLGCVNQKILENTQISDSYHPTYEEKYEMLELLTKSYIGALSSREEYSESELKTRRPQKVKYVNEIAKSIRMCVGEFRPFE